MRKVMKMRQLVILVLITAGVLLLSACQQGVTQGELLELIEEARVTGEQENDRLASELADSKTKLEAALEQVRDLKGQPKSTSAEVSTRERHPVPQGTELLETVGDLWDSLADAKDNEDAEDLYRLLSSNLRDRCSLEDVEVWLPNAGYFFFFEGVMAVFLDAANPHRGVAEMAGEVIGPEGGRGTMSVLMPMVWEEDDWRLVWPMDDPLVKGCPFAL
jgi:hypothetical protein